MKERSRFTHRVSAPIRGFGQRFVFLALVVAAFALMLVGKADVTMMERFRAQVTDAVAPILDVMSRPVATANEVIAEVRVLGVIAEENRNLRLDKERLLHWQVVARKLEAENKALRAQLKYIPAPEASYVTARVIADTGGSFAHSLLLNIGVQPGINKGQAVVTGDGLVGRIAGVGDRSTRVLLITDLNSRIPVLIEATRTRAILAGNNTNRLRLIHLPPGATVSPGDRVVTSGHGGAFPVGLPVGLVDGVSDAGISVQPFVTRDRLEYVRVLDYGLKGIIDDPKSSDKSAEGGKGKP
ncbi:MAG: rod shape-determining protein MreC [Rhodospirillaceae bacterium]|nr:rod shape-determining protein MreC [Rhodospirillaceae bacterium]MBT5245238.1 rod shape-determining protein MreC [Rhodospirillaceae bacterium]MBT5562769.1 rod shape-determining protein MreC [Rhodospirillaceae bacterium]MBT6240698.1 rod shape-determining protein MreC [Rhodospirillaceae bacterium]MBT7137825.1 rod shape-determining protein MreC [Rhodospirillaceae bacterium]